MLLYALIFLWDVVTKYISIIMDFIYQSNYFMALVSCIMAIVFMAHVKSASIILTDLCSPKNQRSVLDRQPSPINIVRGRVYKLEHLDTLRWFCYNELPPAVLLENNGSTVIMRISCSPECTPFLAGGNLPANYYFVEASFKWGSSEHSIDSRSYAMEMQVLHATNIANASYEYLTVSYMFDLAHQKNYHLDQIIDNLGSIRTAGSVIELPPFNLASLMWCFGNDYFSYRGTYANGTALLPSQWAICPRIFYISPDQLARFRDLCDMNGRRIQSNSRQKQPLGDRCVALHC